MTTAQRTQDGSVVDKLKETLAAFLSAQVDRITSKASDKLSDIAGQLTEAAEHDGALPKAGARLLKGESPVKAQDIKETLTGGDSSGGGEGSAVQVKATFISEALDVGVPLRTAYNHWTEYEDFPSFTKGTQDVSKDDEVASHWSVKIGPSTRSWQATVLEQIPDDRIVWRTESGQATLHGAVSFHELDTTLTRILLVVEYQPSGFLEKTGNVWRAQGRRMRLDFKNFQRQVTFAEEEPEGWRGEIQDGKVVRSHEDATAEEQGGDDGGEEDGKEE